MKTETTTTCEFEPADIDTAVRKHAGLASNVPITYNFERTPDGGYRISGAKATFKANAASNVGAPGYSHPGIRTVQTSAEDPLQDKLAAALDDALNGGQ